MSADPQKTDWGGLSWSGWCPFAQAIAENCIPKSGGIYRFRGREEPGLLYIGEGANRRRRLRALELHSKAHPAEYYLNWPHGTKRPHRGHYAAPFLRMCRDAGCVVEVSWAMDVHADLAERRRVEARLIGQYRDEAQADPPWQHGGLGMVTYLARRPGTRTRDEATMGWTVEQAQKASQIAPTPNGKGLTAMIKVTVRDSGVTEVNGTPVWTTHPETGVTEAIAALLVEFYKKVDKHRRDLHDRQ